MKAKHTPGPWLLDETDDTIFVAHDGRIVAQVELQNDSPLGIQTEHADARLIAAAPDLLFWVKRMREMIKTPAAFSADAYEEMYKDVSKLIDS